MRTSFNQSQFYPVLGNVALRAQTRPNNDRSWLDAMFGSTAPKREVTEQTESESTTSRETQKVRRTGSGGPPTGGYIRPEFSPNQNILSNSKTLWVSGIGAILSSGIALITHFSNKEVFGPANDIIKPVLTFGAILCTTIFGACWLTEPSSESIDSTSIAHSAGSIG